MDLGKENATTEFVDGMEQLDDAIRSMAAILNRYPRADVYIGVGPDGKPLGKTFSEDDIHRLRIRMRSAMNTVPDVSASVEDDGDGGQLIHVSAKGGDPPYSFGGWFRVRRCQIVRTPGGEPREEWRDSLTCAMKRH